MYRTCRFAWHVKKHLNFIYCSNWTTNYTSLRCFRSIMVFCVVWRKVYFWSHLRILGFVLYWNYYIYIWYISGGVNNIWIEHRVVPCELQTIQQIRSDTLEYLITSTTEIFPDERCFFCSKITNGWDNDKLVFSHILLRSGGVSSSKCPGHRPREAAPLVRGDTTSRGSTMAGTLNLFSVCLN